MKKSYFTSITFLISIGLHAQTAIMTAPISGSAERIAAFGVIGSMPTEFLEITNSSVFDNQFIPSYWAHHQADNRFVMRFFATTNSPNDNGSIPMMIFRTEIRDNLNPSAPAGTPFPWGITGSDVTARPLYAWENGNTQLMRMLSNGFLGIGTTLPTALLHTNGTVRHENIPTVTTNTYVLTADNNGNVSRQLSSSFVGGSSLVNNCVSSNFLTKNNAAGNLDCSQVFDDGVGVGIGTTSPTSLFHTNGTLRFENIPTTPANTYVLTTDTNGNVSKQLSSSFGGGGSLINNCVNPNFLIKNGAGDLNCSQIFDNGIGVGVGTVNPTALLHTNGTIRFENLTDAVSPVRLLGTDNLGNVFKYDPALFGGGGTPDLDWLKLDGSFPTTSINDDIYTNGKVGIKINNLPNYAGNVDVSAYSLFAKGGILTEEVRVTLSSEWADYVFHKNYQLPPLNEVETYINKEKHLKDIPSESEVKRDGIELGAMNKLLLQKIEELTLYMIDLNKKVDAQNKEIETLKMKK